MNDGRATTRLCQVPACGREATAGEDWREPRLENVEAFRLGIELRFTVRDLAIVLLLCDDHAKELAMAAWRPAEEMLSRWDWRPMPQRGSGG